MRLHFSGPDISFNRAIFFGYVTLIGVISQSLAIDMHHVAPFLLGNMAYLLLGRRLGLWYAIPCCLFVIAVLDSAALWFLCFVECVLSVYIHQRKNWSIAKQLLIVWLCNAPILAIYLLPTAQEHLLAALLSAAMFITTGIFNRIGAEKIAQVSVHASKQGHISLVDQISSRIAIYAAQPLTIIILIALQISVTRDVSDQYRALTFYKQQTQQYIQSKIDQFIYALQRESLLAQYEHWQSIPVNASPTNGGILASIQSDKNGDIVSGKSNPLLAAEPVLNKVIAAQAKSLNEQHPLLMSDLINTPTLSGRVFVLSTLTPAQPHTKPSCIHFIVRDSSLFKNLIAAPMEKDRIIRIQNSIGADIFNSAESPTAIEIGMRAPSADSVRVTAPLEGLKSSLGDSLMSQDGFFLVSLATMRQPFWHITAMSSLHHAIIKYNLLSLGAVAICLLFVFLIQTIARKFVFHYTSSLNLLIERLKQINLEASEGLSPIHIEGGAAELNLLIDDFNAMVSRITNMHQSLIMAMGEKTMLNRQLEERVIERTHELQIERDKANKLASVKARFLANMSHELRTPLTSIIGFTEQITEREDISTDTQKGLKTVLRNGRYLLELVNDILDAAKLEEGKMTVEQISFRYLDIIDDVIETLTPRANEHGIALSIVHHWPLPSSHNGDPLRFRQVLFNLVGNAIKFTHKGRVTIHVHCLQQAELHLEIQDTGVGMSERQVSQLFSAFQQADISTTRKYGGTGLGLNISQQLMHLMGGRLTVVSTPDVGSTFTMIIPVSAENVQEWLHTAPPRLMETSEPKHHKTKVQGHVLVTDDVADLRALVSAIVTASGATVETAINGQEAAQLVATGRFDLVLMDMHMPVMDGEQAARLMRNQGYTGTIIALTADVLEEDQARYIQAGCTDVLAKPVDRLQLVQRLSRYLPAKEPSSQECEALPTANEVPLSKKTIPSKPAASSRTPISVDTDTLPPFVLPLRAQYLQRLPSDLLELEKSTSDLETLRKHCHQVKGSAGSFGFPLLSARASALEHFIKTHKAIDQSLYDALIDAMHEIIVEYVSPD